MTGRKERMMSDFLRDYKQKEDDNAVTSCIGLVLLIPVVMVVNALVLGFVVSKMWLWFIVPLGLPKLSLLAAIGFCMVVGLFRSSNPDEAKGKSIGELISAMIARSVIAPFISLLLGWIVYLLM